MLRSFSFRDKTRRYLFHSEYRKFKKVRSNLIKSACFSCLFAHIFSFQMFNFEREKCSRAQLTVSEKKERAKEVPVRFSYAVFRARAPVRSRSRASGASCDHVQPALHSLVVLDNSGIVVHCLAAAARVRVAIHVVIVGNGCQGGHGSHRGSGVIANRAIARRWCA